MRKVFYKDSFRVLIRLTDCAGHRVAPPSCDWSARIYTPGSSRFVSIGYSAGECRGWTPEGDAIAVAIDNHGLRPGPLLADFQFNLPSDSMPDGCQELQRSYDLELELTADACACVPALAEVELLLPFIKGDKMSYADLTEADREDLRTPLREEFDSKQDALENSEDIVLNDVALELTRDARMAVFIDMWNNECKWGSSEKYFGQYNEDTGYFELNGIKDIGYDEALRIWARSEHGLYAFPSLSSATHSPFGGGGDTVRPTWTYCFCRTYFPIKIPGYAAGNLDYAFAHNIRVESLAFVGGYGTSLANWPTLRYTFNGCTSLREIKAYIGPSAYLTGAFGDCKALETVYLYFTQAFTVDLHWSPKLSEESLRYLVREYLYKQDAAQSTVILHQEVFDRLPDDLVEQAAAKNIIFTTA